MNIIDIILLILLALGVIQGFRKGLIHEVATLAALILGIYGAIKFSDYTASLLIEHFQLAGKYLPVISFAITFLAIVIAVHFLAKILDKLVKAIALGFVNRISGMVFGFFKVAFILSILLFILSTIDKKTRFLPQDKIEGSMLYGPVSGLFPFIFHKIDLENLDIPRFKGKKEKEPIQI